MIELSENLKPLHEPLCKLLIELEQTVLCNQGDRPVTYADTEKQLAHLCGEVERKSHEIALQSLEIDEPELVIDGVLHARVLHTMGTFKTMAGPATVKHARYRPVGVRNAETVDVVSLRTGCVGDGWLPATAKAIAHAVQQAPSRDAQKNSQQLFRLPYSRSAFEDVAHAVGEQVIERRLDVEEQLIRRVQVPTAARTISVSMDRVSLPIEEVKKKPPSKGAKKASKKSSKKSSKREVTRVFRMAYVATITLHDENADALNTIRYGRMPVDDPRELVDAIRADVRALLEKRSDLKVVIVADGAREMWDRLRQAVNKDFLETEVFEVLDFWHVVEKLGYALRTVLHDESSLQRWRFLLLNRIDAVDTILSALRASGKADVWVADSRPVQDAITYLENHRGHMNYTTARRRGFPIGSGVVEAACKSVISTRMKRPGARWHHETGAHIVHLRALSLSDRWDDGVELSLLPLRRQIRRRRPDEIFKDNRERASASLHTPRRRRAPEAPEPPARQSKTA